MTLNASGLNGPLVEHGQGILPETVLVAFAEHLQPSRSVVNGGPATGIAGIGQHSNQPVLRQRTRGPALFARLREPVVSRQVVNMTGVEQRHENVDIEQRDHEPGALRLVEQPLDIL